MGNKVIVKELGTNCLTILIYNTQMAFRETIGGIANELFVHANRTNIKFSEPPELHKHKYT